MELLLKVILAPLLIAGIFAVFKIRSLVWLCGPPLIRNGSKGSGRIFQKIVVWNNGGQTEESISIRLPERQGARLLASSEGLASQDGRIVNIASLPVGDRCEMLFLFGEEVVSATNISIRSKSVKSALHAKSEKDVGTASQLGWILSILLVIVSVGIYAAVDIFFEENKNEAKAAAVDGEGLSANDSKWPEWESVGDFPGSEIAKSYAPPSFPVVAGRGYRKGDLFFVPLTMNNASEKVINFRASLSSSDSSGDPRPWDRKSSIGNIVVGPASQKNVELNIFFPRKIERGYVVLEVTMRYGDEIHIARRNFLVE